MVARDNTSLGASIMMARRFYIKGPWLMNHRRGTDESPCGIQSTGNLGLIYIIVYRHKQTLV
jgi:hypothetical protein